MIEPPINPELSLASQDIHWRNVYIFRVVARYLDTDSIQVIRSFPNGAINTPTYFGCCLAPPKKTGAATFKTEKKNRKTPNTCQDTNAFARPRRGNCHYHNTRTYYIAYAFKHEDNSQRADVRTMFLCVMPPRLCFLEQKNLTRLDDWGLCAHQRCAFGKTVTAGAKGGAKSWWQWIEKNKNPSSGKSKHCFGFVYILPNYSACGINCATTTMFTTLMALRRHHL